MNSPLLYVFVAWEEGYDLYFLFEFHQGTKLKYKNSVSWIKNKNAKMCIFAQKRQPLLNAGKDRCLTFKFALLSHLRVVCVVSLIFNFELSLHLNLL